MLSPASFLENPARFAAAPSPETAEVDSDAVVILSVLLCSLICVVGVAFLARCAWLRRSAGLLWQHPLPDKGLKKRALMLLPKLPFDGAVAAGGRVAVCPICLSEFREGEEIRLLPQCGHGFHVVCVDTWFGSHSNCPSCRRVLVVPPPPSRCRQSGGSSGGGGADAAADLERGEKAKEDGGANGLLT